MGRLTLNLLLSFAQFEWDVTAERIRDKIAASKRKGLWMGGLVPIGYDADGRTLEINADEAITIRTLYDLYEELGTVRDVKVAADWRGLQTRQRITADGQSRGGGPFTRGHIHHILTNPLYAGRIRHRKVVHEGQHPAIIIPERWETVQLLLQQSAARTQQEGIAPKNPNNQYDARFVGRVRDYLRSRCWACHQVCQKCDRRTFTRTSAGCRRCCHKPQ